MRQQSKQHPSQQLGQGQGTMPLPRAVQLFLLSVLGVFGVCVYIVVAVVGAREFEQLQRIELQNEVDLLGGAVETYVDNRLDILFDLVKFPSIMQAVMQPEARKADITDFMSTLSILGTKPLMALLDFEGAEIHRTQEIQDVDFTGYPWVPQLIDGTRSDYAGILQLPGGPHWCIAVPVLYHGQPEGILTAVIPLRNMKKSHMFSALRGEKLTIVQKETVLATFGVENADGSTQKTVLDRFNLTLRYTGQDAQILAARNHILFMVIGLLFLVFLPISLTTVVLARKWFVKPLQQLRDATYSISNKTGKALFTEQRSRIREIALLSKDLKVMAKLVDDRQSKLEELVEARAGELKNQKERLNNILEGTNVGTWEWNVQTGETIFSEKWANIIGYTLKEISPVSIDTWIIFAHPDDLEKSNELLEKHFNGELDYYHFESRMKHKDGSWIWVLDRGKVISWTEEGKPLWTFGTHQEITDQKLQEEKIRHLATHDALTNLPSLRLANDRISLAIESAKRKQLLMGTLFVDLDGFKSINDTHGHDAGDAVLREVAKRLVSCVRKSDTVGRIGGDEFLLVVTEFQNVDIAGSIAKKIINTLSEPIPFDGNQLTIGASIGIAIYPANSNSVEGLIKKADEAMYVSKKSGKNQFTFANSENPQS